MIRSNAKDPVDSLHWEAELIGELPRLVHDDPFWRDRLAPLKDGKRPAFSVHLAILVEPYLEFILDGKKTIESRFSVRRCPPYESVCRGDVIILKRAAGPVVGLCEASDAWFYELDPDSWTAIRRDFARAICAQDDKFWDDRKGASFATLIRIRRISKTAPLECAKRDRRGWVVLSQFGPQTQQLLLGF